MAKVISTKSPNIYVKDRPCKKINDRECSKDQKAKEGLIPFPSNIQQLMVRTRGGQNYNRLKFGHRINNRITTEFHSSTESNSVVIRLMSI